MVRDYALLSTCRSITLFCFSFVSLKCCKKKIFENRLSFFIVPGSSLISKMLKMQLLEDDDDDFVKMGGTSPSAEESRQRHTSDGRPAWMRTLFTSAKGWLSLMPKVSKITSSLVERLSYFQTETFVLCWQRFFPHISSDLTEPCRNIVSHTTHEVP